jgi:FkbM family methyltransferase
VNDEDVYELTSHGATYKLWTWPGKIRNCMKAGRPYEAPLLEHIYAEQFDGTAVDGGANLGNHTMWFAAVCGLQVFAFEPLWHEHLVRNVVMNPGLVVTIIPVALGASETVAYHVSRGRLHPEPNNSPPLEVRTLDSYELTDVTLIKLDVEGMEPDALKGSRETIAENKPVIFSEEWGDGERKAAAAVLRPLGYRRTRDFYGKNQATRVARWDPQ